MWGTLPKSALLSLKVLRDLGTRQLPHSSIVLVRGVYWSLVSFILPIKTLDDVRYVRSDSCNSGGIKTGIGIKYTNRETTRLDDECHHNDWKQSVTKAVPATADRVPVMTYI